MEVGPPTTSSTDDLEKRLISALAELLPAMLADGGGAAISSVEGVNATIALSGTCLFCPSRGLSAAALESGLRKRVPDVVQLKILYPPISIEPRPCSN